MLYFKTIEFLKPVIFKECMNRFQIRMTKDSHLACYYCTLIILYKNRIYQILRAGPIDLFYAILVG